MKTETEDLKDLCPTPSRYQKDSLLKKIFKLYPELKDNYFLDICGNGYMLVKLDQLGMKGEGIDLSKEAIRKAKIKVSKNIKVYQKDFMAMKEKYGLIIIMDIFEHIQDDEEFMRKASSLSKKYLLLNVPAKMKNFGEGDVFYGHYRRYEKEELIKLLNRNNFEIIEFWCYGISFFSKVYSWLIKNKENYSKNKEEMNLKSGYNTPSFMKTVYPIISKFYWILNIQNIFLNNNLGSQYLVLCKKKQEVN